MVIFIVMVIVIVMVMIISIVMVTVMVCKTLVYFCYTHLSHNRTLSACAALALLGL